MALGAAALVFVSLAQKSQFRQLPSLSVALAVFTVGLFLRAWLHEAAYFQSALLWGLYAAFAASLVLVGSELAASFSVERTCDLLARCVLVGAVLNSTCGVLQIMGIPPSLDSFIAHLNGARAIGNVGQANLYANYLALGEASLVYLYIRGSLSLGKSLAIGSSLVLGASLAASRTSALYGAIFVLLAIPFGMRQHAHGHSPLRVTISLAVAILAAQILIPDAMNAFGYNVESGFARRDINGAEELLADKAANLRLLAWKTAAQLFARSPWFGVGPDEFAGAAYRMGLPPAMAGGEIWTAAHNLPLQLLAETGVFAAGLIVFALLAWFYKSTTLFFRTPTPGGWWILACASVEVMHALLEYPLSYAHFLAVTALIMGVGTSGGISIRPLAVRSAAISFAGIGAVLLALYLKDYVRFDLASPVSGSRSLAPDAEVGRDRESLAELSRGLLAPRTELWLFAAFPVDENHLSQKISVGQRVLRLWPAPDVVARQSVFVALQGRDAEASELLEQALRTYGYESQSLANAITAAPEKARVVLGPALMKR